MGKLVLDTSALIAVARRKLSLKDVSSAGKNFFLPEVTVAEFLVGVELSTDQAYKNYQLSVLETFETIAEVIPFDRSQARAWALLSAASIRSGSTRSNFDLAIASVAFVLEAQVLTSDRAARFEQLPGVSAQYF
ncbi:MAG: hypothetical protein RLZZ590_472 [Actinomycetota bacterium]